MKKIKQAIITCCLLIIFSNQIIAQPFTLDERIAPVELIWEDYKKDDAKAKGRVSSKAFSQETDTAYYWIQGLSMYSPTFFSITASNPAAEIKINLYKENWKQPHKSGQIKGKGKWNANFKTEGDFGIQVITASKPINYALLVWTGDEVKVEVPSPFKQGNTTANGKSSPSWFKKNMTLVLVALASLVVILFLLYKLKKAKK